MPTSETTTADPEMQVAVGPIAAELDSLPEAEPADRNSPSRLYRVGAALAVSGLVLVAGGGAAAALVMPIRIVSVLVGLGVLYAGIRRVGLARVGPTFDLTFVLSCVWLAVLVAAAAFAPLLPFAEHEDTTKTLGAKSYAPPNLLSEHPLGTNNFGLDMLARSVYGARSSLIVAVAAVLIGMLVGGTIGILAGYFGGVIDRIIGILTNSLLAVPALILLIALASVLETNLLNISIALAVLAIPSMVRIARANTIVFSQREFVLAARAMGATRWRVMVREIAPNVVLPLASLAMVLISVMIVAEASLSFLGLGIQPPSPTWGNMISEGQGTVFKQHPHIVLVPGLFLFLTVFAFNIIGEKAQKRTGSSREVKL
ncbi:ABC transporter permease [Rhodococcus sp. NPDC003322]